MKTTKRKKGDPVKFKTYIGHKLVKAGYYTREGPAVAAVKGFGSGIGNFAPTPADALLAGKTAKAVKEEPVKNEFPKKEPVKRSKDKDKNKNLIDAGADKKEAASGSKRPPTTAGSGNGAPLAKRTKKVATSAEPTIPMTLDEMDEAAILFLNGGETDDAS